MNDVLDRLAALRTDDLPTDPATVAADVRRGRRALHRRRAVRGGGLAACALVVAGVAGTTLRDPAPQVQRQEGLRLVAYTGEQVPGFTIGKVPEGFVLQGATAYNLNVTRPGDTSSIHDFEDKIVVMLEWDGDAAPPETGGPATDPYVVAREDLPEGVVALGHEGDRLVYIFRDGRKEFVKGEDGKDVVTPVQQPEPPAVEPFDVDGDDATITTNEEGTRTLRYEHGEYTVTIQVWPTLGISDTQLVEFADGVGVTGEAKPGRG